MITKERLDDTKKAYAALMACYPLTLDDLDGEIWQAAPYCSAYHVSNFGRIKSFKHRTKIIAPELDNNGILSIRLHNGGSKRRFTLKRLVAELFIPNPDNLPKVKQIDGSRMNCYVGNLAWSDGTPINYYAKLTSEQVQYIRANPDNLSLYQFAEKFGVHPNTISRIQIGKTYKKAGGTIRPSHSVPDDIKQKIRAEYVFRSTEHGAPALAKKYGICAATVQKIVRA